MHDAHQAHVTKKIEIKHALEFDCLEKDLDIFNLLLEGTGEETA